MLQRDPSKWMQKHNEHLHPNETSFLKGLIGEDVACVYLVELGYIVLKRRFKSRYGEIDIIVRDVCRQELVFVEVKSRGRLRELTDEAVITDRQIKRNIDAATCFFMTHQVYDSYTGRFDLITISSNKVVSHIKSAWDVIQ